MTIDLSTSELTDLCPSLRSHITKLQSSNKKDRLQKLVRKLQVELDCKEARSLQKYSYQRVTLKRRDNLCPSCGQLKPTSTLAE